MRYLLLILLVLGLLEFGYAGKSYRFFGSIWNFLGVEYDSFTDARDGQSYKIYKVVQPFSIQCGENKYCLDTVFVYMFAENIQYITPHSVCHPDGCDKYGRYYPKEDLEQVCPAGWHIPTADEAAIVGHIILGSDTIYGTNDCFIRLVHSKDFPVDGTKITDQDARLDDFPSGWFDSKMNKVVHSGEIGTMWAQEETALYPAYIDFGIIRYDDMNKLVQSGGMEADGNMFPVKCHKVVFKNKVDTTKIVPQTLNTGIYSMEQTW